MKRLTSTGLILLFVGAILGDAFAEGTAFRYQGRLNDNGVPATGNYDLRFSLYNFLAAPTPIGAQTINGVRVSNGLFTVMLDFGAGVFTGPPRWLETAVRTNGAGSFTT